ncbi:MAG: VWA domain-containing protein [Anaerolineales bacterium]|nr:VWA domain-containing protein [Anaerolineales bacterium]
MTFTWPLMLLTLLLIPVFILLYIRIQRRRQKIVANIGSLGFVQDASGRRAGVRRHIPIILFLIGLTILLVALARPNAVVSLPGLESTVILSFDVSGSMAAEDMQPTRMEAAKAAAREFVGRQPSNVKIGVVAFSDGGIAVQPPTNDQEAILAAIDRLAPQRGTSVGSGILASLNAIAQNQGEIPVTGNNLTPVPTPTPVPYGTYIPAAIVLLTDGENTTNQDPIEAAQTAAEQGVRVYTIGVGSAAGITLTVNDFTVFTQLNEPVLQQIASMTDGAYFNAQSEEDLREIYENLDVQVVVKPEKTEITSIFTGISMMFMLVVGAFSLVWFSRLP